MSLANVCFALNKFQFELAKRCEIVKGLLPLTHIVLLETWELSAVMFYML